MREKKSLFESTVQGLLPKLNVVSREEFDIQCKVLQKTILKLQELEKRLEALENHASRWSSRTRKAAVHNSSIANTIPSTP